MQNTLIGDALFTKTQQRVLGLLYGTPDKSFYTNEIMRWAHMGRGTIRRELGRMVSAGILTVTTTGNQHHYQANQDSPVYSELLGIVRKSFGVNDVLKQALKPISSQLELAFIYGSIAKYTDTKVSDIDLMLVGKTLKYGDVMDILVPLEESLQRSINPTIYTPVEFESKLKEKNGFLTRVVKQPMLIIKGAINDFEKPGPDQTT